MLSWLSGKKRQDPVEEAHQVRCRMGVHERSAIVAEGKDLYSTCTHCGRRLVRVAGDWRVALEAGTPEGPARHGAEGRPPFRQ